MKTVRNLSFIRVARNDLMSVQWFSTGCESGWCYFKGSCYLAVTHGRKDYSDAETWCGRAHGYLTEIQTSAENTFVAGLTKTKGKVWIGYNDRTQEGKWIWTNTGESGSYTNWDTGEPNNKADQDCAFLFSGQVRKFWDDIECHYKQWFVCEKGRPTEVQWSHLQYQVWLLTIIYF